MSAMNTMPDANDRNDMTIGELAGLFGLATHVLRHWEAMGLLTPAGRVSGRRRYRKEHAVRVAMILRGKESGFSLEQMRDLLNTTNRAERYELMQRHRAELERRIAQAEAQKALVEHALECPAANYFHCPDFQRLVQELERRIPVTLTNGRRLKEGLGCLDIGDQLSPHAVGTG